MKQKLYNGSAIAIRRKQQGLSQEELAKLCGCTNVYISQVENHRFPSYKLLEKLASALNVDKNELLKDAFIPKKAPVLPKNKQDIYNKMIELAQLLIEEGR
jgi:transcriptional regulator with XRE-family HTH domain